MGTKQKERINKLSEWLVWTKQDFCEEVKFFGHSFSDV